MAQDKTKDPSESTQRRVRRSRLFVLLPALILGVLVADLIWELVRTNVHQGENVGWPWRLTLLGVAPAASMAGVLTGLMLTRQQFARSVRPSLGWVGHGTDSSDLLKGIECWSVVLVNGGSGHCVVQSIDYGVCPTGSSARVDEWVGFDKAKQKLEELSLQWEGNVALEILGPGAPLTAAQDVRDGPEIAAFDRQAVERLRDVLVRVRVADVLGDQYERVISCLRGVDEWLERKDPPSTDLPTGDPLTELPPEMI
jgi:hypothetical protein